LLLILEIILLFIHISYKNGIIPSYFKGLGMTEEIQEEQLTEIRVFKKKKAKKADEKRPKLSKKKKARLVLKKAAKKHKDEKKKQAKKKAKKTKNKNKTL
jgi:hypothetical protein